MNGSDEIEQMEGLQETEEQKINKADFELDRLKEMSADKSFKTALDLYRGE